MLSKSEIKRRKKIKKPDFDFDKMPWFKQSEKLYKAYDNLDTDFSAVLNT